MQRFISGHMQSLSWFLFLIWHLIDICPAYKCSFSCWNLPMLHLGVQKGGVKGQDTDVIKFFSVFQGLILYTKSLNPYYNSLKQSMLENMKLIGSNLPKLPWIMWDELRLRPTLSLMASKAHTVFTTQQLVIYCLLCATHCFRSYWFYIE